jgi:hypothetical protein
LGLNSLSDQEREKNEKKPWSISSPATLFVWDSIWVSGDGVYAFIQSIIRSINVSDWVVSLIESSMLFLIKFALAALL